MNAPCGLDGEAAQSVQQEGVLPIGAGKQLVARLLYGS